MCIQIRQVVSVQNKAFTFAGNNAIILSINTFFASHVQHRPADKKKNKKTTAFGNHVSYIWTWFSCASLTHGDSVASWAFFEITTLYSHSVSFLHLFVCMLDCVSLSPSYFWSAKNIGPHRQTQTQTVCARLTHLLAHACLCACVFKHLHPPIHCTPSHPTCHYTRREMLLLTRGGVSSVEVPEQIALAFITSESIKPKMNHRLLVKIFLKS